MTSPTLPPPRERTPAIWRWVVPALCAVAALAVAVRIAAPFLLPNIDGDAYCYLDKAGQMRAALLAGHLRANDLFYAWLPLYPLLVALGSLVLPGGGHLMLVGKLVSTAAGLAACGLVYRLLVALTGRRALGVAGALLVAFDPWQTLYAANTMTELLFEVCVLAALERVVARRWTAAAFAMVAAGFVRVEAWPLAALVPVAAFVAERRVRWVPVLLVGVAPATWLLVSFLARGDMLAYFKLRNAYVAEYLAYLPERAHLSWQQVGVDLSNLREAAGGVLALGTAVGAGFLAWRLVRRRVPGGAFGAGAAVLVYGYFLGFLLAAYFTHAQPVLWVRYGLIFQPLGVCLTLWWLSEGLRGHVRRVAVALLAMGLASHAAVEAWIVRSSCGNLLLHRQAGALLAAAHPRRVFCDSAAVFVEAGLSRAQVCDSYDLRRDRAGFLEDLRRQGVDYFVYLSGEASTPVKLFPELAEFRPALGLEPYRQVVSPDWRPTILIFRLSPLPPNPPPDPRNGD